MSSLRISSHNRAVGAANAGGDASARPEKADDGADFIAALGAAGAPLRQVTVPFGANTGDAPAGTSTPRKPPADPARLAVAALVVAQVSLVAPDVEVAGASEKSSPPLPSAADTAAIAAQAALVASPGSAPADSGIPAPATNALGTPLTAIANVGRPAASTAGGALPATALASADPAAPDGASMPATVAIPSLADPAAPDGASMPATVAIPSLAGAASTMPTAVLPPTPAAIGDVAPAGQIGSAALDGSQDPTATPGTPAAAPATTPNPTSMGATHGPPVDLTQLISEQWGATKDATGTSVGGDPHDRDTSADVNPAAAIATGAGAPSLAATSAQPGASTVGPNAGNAIAEQISDQLVRLVVSGSREMVMRLRPPELGDVTVRVTVSGRDVAAWFASPQPQVQSAISAALDQLQVNLGNAGYNLNGAWVGADASGAQQDAGLPAPQPIPASVASTPDMFPAPIASSPATSGLNIYV